MLHPAMCRVVEQVPNIARDNLKLCAAIVRSGYGRSSLLLPLAAALRPPRRLHSVAPRQCGMVRAFGCQTGRQSIRRLVPARGSDRGGAGPHSGAVAAARFAHAVDCCLPPHDGQSHFQQCPPCAAGTGGPTGCSLPREEWVTQLTIAEAQRRTEEFLARQMLAALSAVDYELPSFDGERKDVELIDAARTHVDVRHVRGTSDATYLVEAFGDELLMQLQLNVHRLVVVYRAPALDALDAATLATRLERWRIGAEHAGWKVGWRDAPIPGDATRQYVETYCYAFADRDFLEDDQQQLYWRTDIVLMTRYFMLEAVRCGIQLSPRRARFPI
jgi:hypothetical protein